MKYYTVCIAITVMLYYKVDNVVYPSWQAQLKGRKLWYLMPPPECIYRCVELSVTMHPGEIRKFF